MLSVARPGAPARRCGQIPRLPADEWMQFPPVVESVVAYHAPRRDLLTDVGWGERELRHDLEHEERALALDPDVVVAVELVTHLGHVPDHRCVGRAAIPGRD